MRRADGLLLLVLVGAYLPNNGGSWYDIYHSFFPAAAVTSPAPLPTKVTLSLIGLP